MKQYMKPTQKKSPAQIIFDIGTNNLVTIKDSDEIANEILQLAKSAKLTKTRQQCQAWYQEKISEMQK